MPSITPILLLLILAASSAPAQSVFINEIHYDNAGADQNEGVEIAGPAGTDLAAYKLVFYNGATGTDYGELPLSGSLPAQDGTAFGTAFFPRAGIQNGAPDGIALIDTIENSVIQFLSYEGSFVALDGDAAGESSTDIGVSENNSGSPTDSLQLTGSGTVYTDFTWRSPSTASPAMINAGQTFLGAGNPTITLTLMPSTFDEASSTTATLTLLPAPGSPTSVTISNPDPSELDAPSSVTVPASGTTSFTVSAIDDLQNDGTQSVTLAASAEGYSPASATALILDVQRPTRGTTIRLATVNTLDGVGSRNSPEYEALRVLIERLEPDIVCFQEVSSTGDFLDLRDLISDLGFPTLATTDDDFAGQAYSGGSFDSNQNLAIASRYPIVSTTQIGRNASDRKELTRYPLMVEVDVPGTENDPIVVGVHYKASSDDASRYRKAVEAYRTLEAIAAAGFDGTTDNIFVLGDFNEDNDRFMPNFYNTGFTSFADGSNLPATYQLGSDIAGANAITLPYAQFPDKIFGDASILTSPHRQQDGRATRTFIPLGDAALDYILHSQRVADNGNVKTEVYNSALDRAFDGLVKQANPAPSIISYVASDHFAVSGDYELDPMPPLTLSISPSSLSELAGRGAATGTVTLPDVSPEPLEVTLSTARPDAPVRLPTQTLTFDPGTSSKTFPIDVIDAATADPDRSVTITATADGYSASCDAILIYNLEASGRVLLSQYTETPSGASPRGIEVFNCGTDAIDLRGEPIQVIQYTNGSSTGAVVGAASTGILPPGGVVVFGDTTVGDYMDAQGFLSAPDPPISSADNGTPYLNGAGELVYVKTTFAFTGDDALELRFAYGLADVFGTIGQDPGSAWQSSGVTTTGRNLSLLDDLATPSTGFTQPHLRFENTAPGNDLSGFGIPPAANDPFKIWMQSFGLIDPNADPDHDGVVSLIEYATGSDPTAPESNAVPIIGNETFAHRQLISPGRLEYMVETSADLHTWSAANLITLSTTPNGDGTETITYSFPRSATRGFARLRVSLE